MAVITERIAGLEKWRDGNGEPGAAAKLYELKRCQDLHTEDLKSLNQWKNEIILPFVAKANGMMIFWGVLGTLVLTAVVGLIWAVLTHEVTIVR